MLKPLVLLIFSVAIALPGCRASNTFTPVAESTMPEESNAPHSFDQNGALQVLRPNSITRKATPLFINRNQDSGNQQRVLQRKFQRPSSLPPETMIPTIQTDMPEQEMKSPSADNLSGSIASDVDSGSLTVNNAEQSPKRKKQKPSMVKKYGGALDGQGHLLDQKPISLSAPVNPSKAFDLSSSSSEDEGRLIKLAKKERQSSIPLENNHLSSQVNIKSRKKRALTMHPLELNLNEHVTDVGPSSIREIPGIVIQKMPVWIGDLMQCQTAFNAPLPPVKKSGFLSSKKTVQAPQPNKVRALQTCISEIRHDITLDIVEQAPAVKFFLGYVTMQLDELYLLSDLAGIGDENIKRFLSNTYGDVYSYMSQLMQIKDISGWPPKAYHATIKGQRKLVLNPADDMYLQMVGHGKAGEWQQGTFQLKLAGLHNEQTNIMALIDLYQGILKLKSPVLYYVLQRNDLLDHVTGFLGKVHDDIFKILPGGGDILKTSQSVLQDGQNLWHRMLKAKLDVAEVGTPGEEDLTLELHQVDMSDMLSPSKKMKNSPKQKAKTTRVVMKSANSDPTSGK